MTSELDSIKRISTAHFDEWLLSEEGPVALYLRQTLKPVELNDEHPIIYPPTYANIGYNIDELSDGTKVALIDSVGSQANRMEPLFKLSPEVPVEKWLVPQIWIEINPEEEPVSLLELAHRIADATVHAAPGLNLKAAEAFRALSHGDAFPLAVLAPTSFVFGVWDSRGDSGEKVPRIVRSVIRAWDVEVLHAAAQFNSVWKKLQESDKETLTAEAKKKKVDLSTLGFKDAPAVYRDNKTRDRVLGGVVVHGSIEREVTVNLTVLRRLKSDTEEKTRALRRYLLGLSLKAAIAEMDLYLREGCHLRYTGDDRWFAVPRRGDPVLIEIEGGEQTIDSYLASSVEYFRNYWKTFETNKFKFDINEAKRLIQKAAKSSGEEE